MNKTNISTERLVGEMISLSSSRKLPSYDDLARLSRHNNSDRLLKRLIRQLIDKCVEYIDFLHAFCKSGICKCGKAEICEDINFKLFPKKRSSFVKAFQQIVERIRLFDSGRSALWSRALSMPDLTATKITLSAINPSAFHNVMALYA